MISNYVLTSAKKLRKLQHIYPPYLIGGQGDCRGTDDYGVDLALRRRVYLGHGVEAGLRADEHIGVGDLKGERATRAPAHCSPWTPWHVPIRAPQGTLDSSIVPGGMFARGYVSKSGSSRLP